MEIKLDNDQTIPEFQDIIDIIENSKKDAPDEGILYYLHLLKTIAEKNLSRKPKDGELLAMFYCYIKIQELEQSKQS